MTWAVIAEGFTIATLLSYILVANKKEAHVHEWDKWKQDLINIVSPSGKFLYKKGIQTRKCKECGFQERRDA